MAKKVSIAGLVALAILVFLIWNNPSGTATTVNGFLEAVGRVLGEAWDRLAEFLRGLAGG